MPLFKIVIGRLLRHCCKKVQKGTCTFYVWSALNQVIFGHSVPEDRCFFIFFYYCSLFVLRALCNLTVSDWLGNQPRSVLGSFIKQANVGFGSFISGGPSDEKPKQQQSQTNYLSLSLLRKGNRRQIWFRQLVSSRSKIIHSAEAAKCAARLLSKVHSKLLHKFDAQTADEVCHAYLLQNG